jgi:hypothetical protein
MHAGPELREPVEDVGAPQDPGQQGALSSWKMKDKPFPRRPRAPPSTAFRRPGIGSWFPTEARMVAARSRRRNSRAPRPPILNRPGMTRTLPSTHASRSRGAGRRLPRPPGLALLGGPGGAPGRRWPRPRSMPSSGLTRVPSPRRPAPGGWARTREPGPDRAETASSGRFGDRSLAEAGPTSRLPRSRRSGARARSPRR